MMKCKTIMEIMEKRWPASFAMEWDNVGLQVGDEQKDVRKILTALDLNEAVMETAVKKDVDMIITHHPLLFHPLKKILRTDLVGRRVMWLIEHDIAAYAVHTNFDVLSMAHLNGASLDLMEPLPLDVTGIGESGTPVGIGQVGFLPEDMSMDDCVAYVKKALDVAHVRVYGTSKERISRAAVSGGSGKSAVAPALANGAQVLITGDIDHHTGTDAAAQGLVVIDAGHYGTESIFVDYMKETLPELLPKVQVEGIATGDPCSWY